MTSQLTWEPPIRSSTSAARASWVNEPCVVAVERESRKILGIGLEAKRMLGRTPADIEAIRPLKDGVIADVDVTELMLRHFLKQVTSRRIFRMKPRVVVGVPSGITELERRAVRSSALMAGAKSVYMVVEPVAARSAWDCPSSRRPATW